LDVFRWDQNFETGLNEVDNQHQHLVRVTNQFGNLLSEDEVTAADLEEVFAELIAYTQYHFEEEEKLMVSKSLDNRFLEQHQGEHQGFLREVGQLHREKALGSTESNLYLFKFLMNWLIFHILGSDQKMARQINAIAQGYSPVEAFEKELRPVDQANVLLLNSLNNLFHQVSTHNKQLMELNQSLESKVGKRTRELSEANRQLKELATTDVLTGLPNRRYALQLLGQLWEEAAESNQPLACMMIDADGFKKINDNYGHDAGDLVLCELAKRLQFAVRTDDIVCRLGGDEFLIICPKTDKKGAMHIAGITLSEVGDLNVQVSGSVWQGSISVGVAVRTKTMQGLKDLIKAADLGVYAAKNAGKNCVKMAD